MVSIDEASTDEKDIVSLQSNKLKSIEKVIKLMGHNLEVEETYQQILDLSCQMIGAENGGFLLEAKNESNLELKVMKGLKRKHFIKLNFSKDDGCLGKFYQSEKQFTLVELAEYKTEFDAQLFLEDAFETLMAVKVRISEQSYGILFFLHHDKHFFSYQDIPKINTIIEYAPFMLNKAEVFEKMERNVAGLSTLQKTSNTINSTLDLEEVFELTVDVIMGTMGVSMAALFIKEDESDDFKLVASAGIPPERKEHIMSIGNDLSHRVIKNKREIIKDSLSKKLIKRYELDNIKSVISIPLLVREREIGVINAAQTEFARNFKEADRKFLTTLANQIAIAIENARMYKQMQELATKDGLTKLYNHSHFQEVLDKEIENVNRHGGELSVLMLDIDNFKGFNDTYGHQVGDEVLKKLAKLLKEEVRVVDTVARYGGEEFSIILPKTDQEAAYQVADRINRQVRNMVVRFDELELKVTVSIGLATYQLGNSKKKLISDADQALYEAKHRGKDQTCRASNISTN